MRVLQIEDDSATAGTVELMLKAEGFNVYTTDLGEEGVDLVKHYTYEAIVLDLNLPDLSGLDVLRQIRAAGIKTPVLISTGTTKLETKVACLNAGADDYLTKPFHKDELVARLRALVRRSQGHAESVITVGPLTVRMDQRIAEVGGVLVHLTGKEWAILELLALRKDRTVSKDDFFNHIYGGIDEPEVKIVDVFICKLRQKLRAHGAGDLIATVWGRGYRLTEDAPAPKPAAQHRVAESIDNEQRVLAALAEQPGSCVSVGVALALTAETVRRHLTCLAEQGRARHVRGGRPNEGPAVFEITPKGRIAIGDAVTGAAA